MIAEWKECGEKVDLTAEQKMELLKRFLLQLMNEARDVEQRDKIDAFFDMFFPEETLVIRSKVIGSIDVGGRVQTVFRD